MSGVRPTSSRVREAIFSMVGQDLAGVTVLDAYGGSGLLGLEAWSRGGSVVVVERHPGVARAIQRTVDALEADVVVRNANVEEGLGHVEAFDLVLADPPYDRDPLEVLARLESLVGSRLVLETASGQALPAHQGALSLDRHRSYGRTDLWVYFKARVQP